MSEAQAPKSALDQWINAQRQMLRWKAEESRLRKLAIAERYGDALKPGVNALPLDDGWRLSCEMKQTYKLTGDRQEIAGICGQLSNFGLSDETINKLIRWKAEISRSTYDALPTEAQAIVMPILTISDATPTLAIVPNKKG